MPQVPQSYQLPACLMQLTGLRFRQGQQIAWHLVQRLKEIGELVSKHFNQSMTFYDDFVVNCRVKGDRKSTGTWHLNLRFSTSDFQATTALSVEVFLEESYIKSIFSDIVEALPTDNTIYWVRLAMKPL